MRFLLIDDHPLVREGTAQWLRAVWPEAVVDSAGNLEEGLELARTPCQLCLLDLKLPGCQGIDAFLRLRQHQPETPVVVLTASDNERDREACLRGGAHAYLNKQIAPDALVATLTRVLAGQRVGALSPAEARAQPRRIPLTGRQREVLQLMCDGYPNKEIAGRMDISETTVKTHVTAIFLALNVANRTQAVIVARQGKWLSGEAAGG